MKRSLLSLMLICFAFFGVAKAQQSLPYSYGFEDNNLATDGWIANVTSSSSGINSQAAQSGSYGFMFNYSEQSGSLISPVLTGGDKGVDVSFWYKEYSSSWGDEQFYVGYTTDESTTDVDRFTYGDIITASTSWQEYTNSFPAGTKRIAIKYVYNDAFYLYLDDFTFEAPTDCAKPTNLTVNYEGGTTATVTWEGEARSYNIDVNGTVTTGVNSPYTLSNLEYATNYTVMVQSDCGDEQSGWVSQSFRTDCGVTPLPFFCGFEDESEYGCLALANTASGTGLTNTADYVHGGSLAFAFAYNSNPPQYLFFPEFEGTVAINMSFFYKIRSSNYPETFQVGYSTTTQTTSAFTWLDEVTATNASEWLEYEETLPNGTKYVAIRYNSNDMYYLYLDDFNFEAATGCIKPTGLEATNVGTTSAVLNWTGDNDSYVLQYRTGAHNNMDLWEQVGSDKSATATLTQYTYDLSEYSGTGSIAIRHYNVSDMFRLAIDDVVVTDERGQELVNEDFESGSIPSSWTNYDLDGDGYIWAAINFDSQVGNGDYVAVSDSWNQSVGPLTPDNWLIIPDVALGGTLTFYARGVDANYPQENFGVFVTTASLETVFDEVPAGEWVTINNVRETSYQLTGLTANTPYEWQVKGICGDVETGWAASSFSTIAEGFKTFITEGNWNVADNWFPAGVPTIEDEVSIEAAATVPAGVVATAKRAVLNGGSILVKDGGQLKQGAATLNITMEKEITGYGESDGNYYFIASPFGGRTQLAYNASWSHVLNVTSGEYDLYAFDPTQELEWINYKSQDSNNPHELFYEMSLQSGTGYLYANKDNTTLTFTGTAWSSLNSSTTVDYTYNAESTDDFNGWKLVGNPYTCNGYISYVDERGNVLDADFYTLNLNNKYSLMSSNQPLPPCTGALMNVSATGKVQYSTEPTNSKGSMLNMTVSEGRGTVDQVRVRFGQGHNLQHMSFRNSSKLYMPVNGNDYAVVYADTEGEMPVNFKAEKNGNYTISINNENIEFGYLHLIDNMTGVDINLLDTPSYSFDAKVTDYASRFKLVFAAGSNNNDSFAFYNNGNIVINNEGSAILNIVDVLGRTISSQTINGSENVSFNANAGVYTLQLIQGENVKTQKIVVE